MSERSRSLLKMALVGAVLALLLFGAFQVLFDEGEVKPPEPAPSSPSAQQESAETDLVAAPSGTKAGKGAPRGKAEALPDAPDAPRETTAGAPRATVRAQTWEPAEGTFTGRVLDLAGKGVAEAQVTLLRLDPERLKGIPEGMRPMWIAQMKKGGNMAQLLSMLATAGSVKTDAEGRFALEAPTEKVEHWLRIQHPDYCDVVSHDFKAAPRSLSVSLQEGGTVEVTVSAPDTTPLQNPRVTFSPGDDPLPAVQASPLGFQLDVSSLQSNPWGNRTVAASAKKEAAAEAKAEAKAKAAGAKAKEAPVALELDLEEASPKVAFSRTFTQKLKTVPAGRHSISASADSFQVSAVEVTVTEGNAVAVPITLAPGLTILGTVVDERGQAIADAHVSAWRNDLRTVSHMRSLSGKTDAEGRFTIKGLNDATYRISASAANYQQTNWNTNAVPGGDRLKIVLNRTYTIRGKVLADGKPVAGLNVHAESKRQPWFGRGGQPTKKDGTFELQSALPGRYLLTAKDETRTTLDPVAVTVKDADVEGVVIEVRAGAKAEVRVVGKDGKPVGDAKVILLTAQEARWNRGWVQQNGKTPTTDADGKVTLEGLGPGEYVVEAAHPDYARGKATLRVDEGKDPGRLRVELERGATLNCRILNSDGTPFASKALALIPQGASLMSPAAFRNSVSTDAEGKFSKSGLAAGRYRLTAMDMGGGQRGGAIRPIGEAQLSAGRTTELELRIATTTARVGGRVLQGTKPQPGAHVMVYREGDLLAGFAQTMTDKDGAFTTESLAPGKYVVTASGAGKTTVELQEGRTVEVTLVIQAGVVAGKVVGPDGAPAAGARLYLQRLDAGGTFEERFRGSEAADGLGAFKLDKVRPGRYRLLATLPGVGASKGTELTLGEEEAKTGLNLILSPGGALNLNVSNPDGTPAVGTRVSFYHVGLGVFSHQIAGWGGGDSGTDRHGVVKLENLIPGEYVVFATSAGSKQALLEGVTVADGTAKTQALTLAKPGTLKVQAPPQTQVKVTLVRSKTPIGGPWAALFGLSKTDGAGELELQNLPSVEVEVTGTTTDGRTVGPWRGTIPAGETAEAALN